ncbi:MAG TPA: molybdopterin molybdotransferase MoeA, partial [Candidatus Deferrimicrobiaceae bacterium]
MTVPPLPFDEAVDALLALARTHGTGTVLLPGAAGCVLAEDVLADRPIPPFDRAAMDGFAIRFAGQDAGTPFRVVGTVGPGQAWSGDAGSGDALRIMTGARVPPPFDTVIPFEDIEGDPDEETVELSAAPRRGQHVAKEGEDAPAGECLVAAGTLLRPRHVATLAAAGIWEVPVQRPPSIAILATGNELREPWEKAEGPFIRNGNAHFLLSAFAECGFRDVRYLGIAPDEDVALTALLREGLKSGILVVTGGVSAGDTDRVPDCLAACGVEPLFHRVAVQPGKPVYVGAAPGGSVAIGLPGNPVAVMLHFAMLVRPFLLRSCGVSDCLPKPVWLPLADGVKNRSGRLKYAAARLESSGDATFVQEISSHGSGDFVSAVWAEGVLEIPADVTHIPAGAPVRFY